MKPSNPDRTFLKAAAMTVAIAGGLVVANSGPVEAASIEVTTLVDVVADDGETSLREAISAANAQSGPDVITFAPGLSGTSDLSDRLSISDDLQIAGPGESVVALTSAQDALYLYDDAVVALSGLTIDSPGRDGIVVSSASVAMADVTVSNAGGRGVALEAGAALTNVNTLSMSGSTISGSALEGIEAHSTLGVIVENSSVVDNGRDGIAVRGGLGEVRLSGVTSERNAVGLRTEFIAEGTVLVEDSTLSGNVQGISADSSGRLSITDSTLVGNLSVGVVAANSAALTIADSTISGSPYALYAFALTEGVTVSDSEITESDLPVVLAALGGSAVLDRVTIADFTSVAVSALDVADVSIISSTITGGEGATEPLIRRSIDVARAGAMPAAADSGLTIAHSTISGNAAAGIVRADGGDVVIDHSIVTGNSAAPVVASDDASTLAVTNSVVPVGRDLGASNTEADDPLLGALGDNGGRTRTMLPRPASRAIDAGDLTTAVVAPAPTLDQRGAARTAGPAVDIGAVETEAPDAVPVSVPLIVPIDPARLVDTRPVGATVDDLFAKSGRRAPGTTFEVDIAGRGGVPGDAAAAVLNVTAVNPGSGGGFATVHPCLSTAPNASSLNFTERVTVSNEVVAQLSAAGEVCVFVQGDIHLVIDVTGVVAPDSAYEPVDPARLVDTRPTGVTIDNLLQRGGPRQEIVVKVGGRAGVPVDAAAAVVNLAAVRPTTNGFVMAHPCLATAPLASSLNYVASTNRANEIVAPLNDAGELCLSISGQTNVLVDVAGYVPDDPAYVTTSPTRFVDTRPNEKTFDARLAGGGPRPADSQLLVPVAGRSGVPPNAVGVIANITVAGATATGFVTSHPCLAVRPNASSLNYVERVNGASEVLIKLDGAGNLCLYTSAATNLIVDVVGYLIEPR